MQYLAMLLRIANSLIGIEHAEQSCPGSGGSRLIGPRRRQTA